MILNYRHTSVQTGFRFNYIDIFKKESINTTTVNYPLSKGGVVLFDWGWLIQLIIAILQAIAQNLPV